jgi:hypothetical protein
LLRFVVPLRFVVLLRLRFVAPRLAAPFLLPPVFINSGSCRFILAGAWFLLIAFTIVKDASPLCTSDTKSSTIEVTSVDPVM